MHAVESSDAMSMQDSNFAELLDELNRKYRQKRLAVWLPVMVACVGGLIAYASVPPGDTTQSPNWGIVLAAAGIAWAIGRWFDSYRRVTVLAYDLDAPITKAYEAMASAFAILAGCNKKFRVDAGGAVADLTTWKRNAGASHLLKTEPLLLDFQLPQVIRSNLMPPMLRAGGRSFYFLPDVLLVLDRGGFGGVGYAQLQIQMQTSRWIETQAVPRDTQVVGETWEHPNKGGGPDRRFKQNRRLPICLHDVLHLSSSSGMNELLEFSRPGSVAPFKAALADLPRQTIIDPPRLVRPARA